MITRLAIVTFLLGATAVAAADDPLETRQREVFALINHPYPAGAPLSSMPVKVGIVGIAADLSHCAFSATPSMPCGDPAAQVSIADLGTHLAGIVGARAASVGLVGVNPSAQLISVDLPSLTPVVDVMERLRRLVQEERPRVVQLAVSYAGIQTDRSDPMEELVANASTTLFVTSAGNDNRDVSASGCSIRPACLDRRNLISVIALTRDGRPAPWSPEGAFGTNVGAQFSIAAPGEGIRSAVSDNRSGILSGTTQAAAYVTGAASLLVAAEPALTPSQIKHRLIYSSQLFESLRGKALGGRLDIGTALDFRDDLVKLRSGVTLRGRLDKSTRMTYTIGTEASPRSLQLFDVARVVRESADGAHTLFVATEGTERVRKLEGVRIGAPTALTMFVRDGDVLVRREIPLAQVRDYIAAVRTLGFPGVNAEMRVWTSERATLQEIDADVVHLLRRGSETGRIPVIRVRDDAGRDIRELAADFGLFSGGPWPADLERLLCTLNDGMCTAPPGTTPRWQSKPAQVVRLPDVVFRHAAQPKLMQKDPDTSVEQLTTRVQRGCATFDILCRAYLLNVNGQNARILETGYAGPVRIPTVTLSTEIDAELARVIAAERPDTLAPTLQFKRQSDEPSAPREKQKRTLELVAHPFYTGTAMPNASVRIAVIGDKVDRDHCGLQDDKGRIVVVDPAETTGNRSQCGEPAEKPDLLLDHGTHVAGIIAARDTKIGSIGVNPSAELETYSLDFVEFRLNTKIYAGFIARKMTSLFERTEPAPSVINLSWGYDSFGIGKDPIESFISDHDALFVAAAGNNALDTSSGACPTRPACFDFPNLVSVVALTQDNPPGRWDIGADGGSNFGTKFSLAAPGGGVVSTVTNNRYGPMSGTSQATPLVAGAASLLISKDRDLVKDRDLKTNPPLTPAEIKERLIYSSDFLPSLAEHALGGLLNIDRALAFQDDLVLLKKDSWPRRGRLIAPPNTTVSYYLIGTLTLTTYPVSFERIRRIAFDEATKVTTLVLRPSSPIESYAKVTKIGFSDPGSVKLQMKLTDGGVLDLSLDDIRDFTAALRR